MGALSCPVMVIWSSVMLWQEESLCSFKEKDNQPSNRWMSSLASWAAENSFLGFLSWQYQSLSYWWLVGWWLAGRLLLTGALLTGNFLNGWMCQGSINPLVGARCGISLFGKCVLQSCPFSFPSSLTSASGHSLAQLIEQAQRTTADSHLSTMVQKTVVCRSNVVKHLHSGSFGEVYLGKWREDQVAVKIFSERHSDVWYKEVEVYQVSFHSTSCSLDVGMPYQCLAYLECHYRAVYCSMLWNISGSVNLSLCCFFLCRCPHFNTGTCYTSSLLIWSKKPLAWSTGWSQSIMRGVTYAATWRRILSLCLLRYAIAGALPVVWLSSMSSGKGL